MSNTLVNVCIVVLIVMTSDSPKSPAASHGRCPSVTPGMGIKVAATKVAMLGSVSMLVSLRSAVGVGEVTGGGRSVRPTLISGSGASGGDVLCSTSLPGGGVGLSELDCGVKAISGRTVFSGTEEVLLPVVCVGIALVVVGVVGFKVLFFREEILPGAGGDAVLRALTRDVGIFPPGGGAGEREEPVLELGWVGVDFFPEIGAGAVLTKGLGLGVVVVLRESKTLDFGVEGFFFDGGCGGFSFSLGDL